MKKKLLAGIMALALCSTSIPQMIFAEEFMEEATLEETEETPEVFTDENQAAAGDEIEGVSEFSSEEVPEFDDEGDNVAVATDAGDITTTIDITNPSSSGSNYSYSASDQICKIQKSGSYRFNGNNTQTSNRIVIENITSDIVKIYLNNVNIETSAGPALLISQNVTAKVYIYLEGNNFLTTTDGDSAALQKNNVANANDSANLIINTCPTNSGNLTAMASYSYGAGIGGGSHHTGSGISILGGSVTASSYYGAGIGGGGGAPNSSSGTGSNISISGGSVTASSYYGAGIGGGYYSTGRDISISGGSVTASSYYGAGIGGGTYGAGSNISISGGSVTASSADKGAGIGGGGHHSDGSNISISGGSVTASSGIGGGRDGTGSNISISGGSVDADIIGCKPTLYSVTTGAVNPKVYLCIIPNLESDEITIDETRRNSPYIHSPQKRNLYAWLTGEDHVITVGKNKTSYIFDSNSGTFSNNKRNITNDIFEFDGQNEFIYDGTSKTPTIKRKDTYKGVGNITVKYFKGSEQITEPKDVGTYTIKIGVEEGDFYKATSSDLTNESWKFNITKGTLNPTITKHKDSTYDGISYPVINIDQNTIPQNSTIEYSVDDKQTWNILNPLNPNNDIPTVSTVEEAKNTKIYIRISNSNYDVWTSEEYNAIINPAAKAPGYPSKTTISVPWSCKKVNEIATNPLPANWEWKGLDKIKDLNVGDNTATAIYTGKDANKGNYKTEFVTYTITREACKHPHTTERYYSSPSCTSSGYSGDTYCADCGVLISSGYTISAYGHDYDNGVITTEPTTETDGIITYTCKRCKHQDTKILGKLGDGEPYIEGSFQKKGWKAVNDLIKASQEKDTISIIMNGAETLPASVLSGIKGKDISLNLDMENGFIWKINGTSITAETPADTDLSVTNTAEYIPAALYSLISTNQHDFGFHLGRSGAFDFPAVLSVKADASCAGLMANLFWYDVENGVLQCIQTVTVGGAFEDSILYADFTLSKGQDYFIAFGTESLNGRVIHTDGSITDENGAYLRPANTKISSHSIDRNKLTVKLSKGCAGAQGYDFVISKKSNMLQTGKFSKTVSSTGKPQASFRYLAKGTWYVAARSWVLDEQGNKVYGSWTKVKKIKITVVTPQQPKIKDITVKENTVTVTYTKCKNATGYEILLGNKYKTSAGEKYPVKKYLKRTEGKNTVTVTFTIVKKGTWYVTVRSWNKTSKNKSRVYSPYSDIKKFKVKK